MRIRLDVLGLWRQAQNPDPAAVCTGLGEDVASVKDLTTAQVMRAAAFRSLGQDLDAGDATRIGAALPALPTAAAACAVGPDCSPARISASSAEDGNPLSHFMKWDSHPAATIVNISNPPPIILRLCRRSAASRSMNRYTFAAPSRIASRCLSIRLPRTRLSFRNVPPADLAGATIQRPRLQR